MEISIFYHTFHHRRFPSYYTIEFYKYVALFHAVLLVQKIVFTHCIITTTLPLPFDIFFNLKKLNFMFIQSIELSAIVDHNLPPFRKVKKNIFYYFLTQRVHKRSMYLLL